MTDMTEFEAEFENAVRVEVLNAMLEAGAALESATDICTCRKCEPPSRPDVDSMGGLL